MDTVFVCRGHANGPPVVMGDGEEIVAAVAKDVADLKAAGRVPTRGDARCVLLGHATRLAVREYQLDWDRAADTPAKLSLLREAIERSGDLDGLVARALAKGLGGDPQKDSDATRERQLALSV